jgi:2-polyprenyl-6-methoxyphenol hydroxylase-like FAD-dependent oxidoreductase
MAASSGEPPDGDPDVLIVGGSLVGLSTALFLRLHGVSCLAVERHTSTAIHPRAGHFQLRTVEILRAAGLEEAVRRKGEEQYHPNGGINNVESLAGREIASYFPNLNAGVDEFSPTVRLFIDQDALEPILRGRAEELGAKLRYRVDCTSVVQDRSGVLATLRDLDSGAESTVRSKYLVAADGNRSRIREQLGIAMRGHGLLSNSVTIYFRAEVDLAPLLEGRDQGVNYVTNPVLRGFFRLDRTGNRGFLVVNLVGDTARPEIIAAYPSAPWANVAETIDEPRAVECSRSSTTSRWRSAAVATRRRWSSSRAMTTRCTSTRANRRAARAHVHPTCS